MKLSVIVCTRDRAYAIAGCLDSIADAISKASPIDAEIIVVDNASGDDTSAVINTWAKSCAFPVRVLFEPQKGLSNARNCGIQAAQGELLAFTDDDCRMSKDYVTDLLRHDASDSSLVLRGGRIDLGDPADLPLSIKTLPVLTRWSRKSHSARHENLADTIYGCNMAMRHEAVEKLGLFDNRFGAGSNIPGGEDTDYIFRAYLADIAIEYVPDMAVSHYHGRKSVSDGNKLIRNYSIGSGALFAKYFFKDPNLCRPFYWDMKSALKDIFSGKNTYMPEMEFSHKDKIIQYFVGIKRYCSANLIKASAGA